MDKGFYKKFAQKYLLFSLNEYENKVFEYQNKTILFVWVSRKRENEEVRCFAFEGENCEYVADCHNFDLSEAWKKYLKNQENVENFNK